MSILTDHAALLAEQLSDDHDVTIGPLDILDALATHGLTLVEDVGAASAEYMAALSPATVS